MLKQKKELDKILINIVNECHDNSKICKRIYTYAYKMHQMQTGTTMRYLSQSKPLEETTEFEAYCLLEAMQESEITQCDYVAEFFTDLEIKNYSKEKFSENKIEFPIIIPCIQISEEQWIGGTDVEFFMKLRNSQLIRYNENAQRVMKKIVKGDTETYKIAINNNAVKAIADLMRDDAYIPNTITLNIPDDVNSSYYYDSKKKELVIESLDTFDISDGYHRYLGMQREYDKDNNFNYPMELRIIHFSNTKISNFIYQEDQKTKMSRIQSNSMNMNSLANIITSRLNEDVLFDLHGQIKRNGGLIDFSWFSKIINVLWELDKVPKDLENAYRINLTKEIKDKFNLLVELDNSYLSKKYSYNLLLAILIMFKVVGLPMNHSSDLDIMIDNFIDNEDAKEIFKVIKPSTTLFENRVSKLMDIAYSILNM